MVGIINSRKKLPYHHLRQQREPAVPLPIHLEQPERSILHVRQADIAGRSPRNRLAGSQAVPCLPAGHVRLIPKKPEFPARYRGPGIISSFGENWQCVLPGPYRTRWTVWRYSQI